MTRSQRLDGSKLASWERWESSEVARWERWESSEVTRWEVPGFIRRGEKKLCCSASGK